MPDKRILYGLQKEQPDDLTPMGAGAPAGGIPIPPLMQEQMMQQPDQEGMTAREAVSKPRIGEEEVRKAATIMRKYKAGKARLENRIIRDQQWWKLRNWQMISEEQGFEGMGSEHANSAWLWSCITGRHADAMDSYPEPVILPREEDDKEEAKILSEVIPVVLQQNHFNDTYSEVMWQKLQEGTGCYGVYWDQDMLNGMGDICIKRISMLNLFFEPGISDIQDSRHVFYASLQDNDILEQMYPELEGKLKGNSATVSKYIYDDNVDTGNKSLVVDWYYHRMEGSRKILHYCKFVGNTVLYATENDPELMDRGLYDDGLYPFVLDVYYPQ